MLHLQSRIHLKEVELPFAVEELDGPSAPVVHRSGGLHGSLAHGCPLVGGQKRRRRLLDELLVTPLNRAFPLAQMNHLPRGVPEDLNLDVARAGEVLLEVDGAVPEGGLGLPRSRLQSATDELRGVHDPHPFSTPPGGGLEEQRKSELLGHSCCLVGVGQRVDPTRTIGTPAACILRRASVLSPMAAMVSGRGPMKTRPASST